MGIYDGAIAQAQQASLRGAAGLGGFYGGCQGIGQTAGFHNISAAEDRIRAYYQSNPYKEKQAVKTLRTELQEETDEWLKDI